MEQARVIIGINSDNFRGLYPNAQKNQYTLPLDRVTKGRGFVEKLNFGLFFLVPMNMVPAMQVPNKLPIFK